MDRAGCVGIKVAKCIMFILKFHLQKIPKEFYWWYETWKIPNHGRKWKGLKEQTLKINRWDER